MLNKPHAQKVVVLGIDGVPQTLLHRFSQDGTMPNISRLLNSGTLSPMNATLPEVSSTSWSTFMSGVNPGRHNIFGFMEIDRNTYAWRFTNFDDMKAKPLWNIAGESGKTSIVMNIPQTYPAQALPGMLVAGFVALDLKKASYPDRMHEYLSSIKYRLDVDLRKAGHTQEYADDIMSTFRKRQEAIHHLYDTEPWDLFIAGITETDRLHHHFWAALDNHHHPQHDFFLEFYRELDRFIGSVAAKTGEGIPLIIVSDHGFTECKQEVYLNYFLQDKGYLRFSKPDPESFAFMTDDSQAFALDPSRIYLHKKDRYARGCITSDQCTSLREAIKKDLLALEVEGKKVIREVFYKEDIYSGPFMHEAPDLVVLAEDGYDLKGTTRKNTLCGKGALTGCHTRHNATFYINRHISATNIDISDITPTILHLLGIDPLGLDGRILS